MENVDDGSLNSLTMCFERHEPPRSNKPIFNSLISIAILISGPLRSRERYRFENQAATPSKRSFYICGLLTTRVFNFLRVELP
jgi:hypothetical protein